MNEAISAAVTHRGVPVHYATATTPSHSHAFFKRCTASLPNPLTNMACCSPTERTQARTNLACSLCTDPRLMCTEKIDGVSEGVSRRHKDKILRMDRCGRYVGLECT